MRANGEIFRAFRKHLKLSQSLMAEFLLIDKTEIMAFEKNRYQFNINLLEKSSDLFGCSVSVFFEEDFAFSTTNILSQRGCFDKNNLNEYALINRIAKNLEMMENLDRNEN